MTFQCACAYCRASSRPMPRLAPVMRTVGASGLSWARAQAGARISNQSRAARPMKRPPLKTLAGASAPAKANAHGSMLVAQGVLHSAHGILHGALGLVGLAFALGLLVAGQVADRFLHLARLLLDGAFHSILV